MYSFSKSVIESLEKNQGEELFNKKQGIEIKGELLIPKERKRIEVELTPPRGAGQKYQEFHRYGP